MNLYLLTQRTNNGYDTYDSCVVAAESESDARTIHPDGSKCHKEPQTWDPWTGELLVTVAYIGDADPSDPG